MHILCEVEKIEVFDKRFGEFRSEFRGEIKLDNYRFVTVLLCGEKTKRLDNNHLLVNLYAILFKEPHV